MDDRTALYALTLRGTALAAKLMRLDIEATRTGRGGADVEALAQDAKLWTAHLRWELARRSRA